MAVELKRLIEKVAHMDITLIAGENGLSNIVSWIHMVETREASTFLEGGEIAFSTGIGLGSGLSLLELVRTIYRHKAAGIVLNLGPFLENVPAEVTDFGNSHDFPIFTVPWKIHIAEIMRIFCYAITKSDQHNMEIAAAFKNAIFFPKQEELYMVSLSQQGFNSGWNYYVCAVKIVDAENNAISRDRLASICIKLDNHLRHLKHNMFAVFHSENQLLAIAGNYDEDRIKSFINDINSYIHTFLKENEYPYIGVGKCTRSVRCLYKSYNQALSIQKLHEKNKIAPELITYSDMGIYGLFMGIEDPDIIADYYEKTIKPLEEYDRKNHSDLCFVLRSYLTHNGSVKDTADELFVHRNTINYKLNKAAEVLNVNLSLLDTKLRLSLGFMLHDMI